MGRRHPHDRLKGLLSSHAMREHGRTPRAPFQTDTYTRTSTASTDDLITRTPSVVENLLGNLARGLGLRDYLFPYDDPKQIAQRLGS